MAWRYTEAGPELGRPDRESGIFIEGPLTMDDWQAILQGIVEAMVEQAKREAVEEISRGRSR